jgi:hypothetical protein
MTTVKRASPHRSRTYHTKIPVKKPFQWCLGALFGFTLSYS